MSRYGLYLLSIGLILGISACSTQTVEITVRTPAQHIRVSGDLVLEASVATAAQVSRVDFYWQNKKIASAKQAPYRAIWKVPADVSGDTVEITAKAVGFGLKSNVIAPVSVALQKAQLQTTGNQWQADVVVVGCHAAGSGTALTAAQQGLGVVMLCEESRAGGMLTAGQIGFVDGSPRYEWRETPGVKHINGDTSTITSWEKASTGIWQEFRTKIAEMRGSDVKSTIRYLPREGAQALDAMIASYPNLKVVYKVPDFSVETQKINQQTQIKALTFSDAGQSRTITAKYWVDGSDSGRLVGKAKLPYELGIGENADPNRSYAVMRYGYRPTLESTDEGYYPKAPPAEYAYNLKLYQDNLERRLALYQKEYNIPKNKPWILNPFMVFVNFQGRLTGDPKEYIQSTVDGSRIDKQGAMFWDYNGFPSEDSLQIAQALYVKPEIKDFFDRLGIKNPYGPTANDIVHRWVNIAWLQDGSQLTEENQLFLIDAIKQHLKNKTWGVIWYIRSGDLQKDIRKIKGAEQYTVDTKWSLSKQFDNTLDGIPELMYEREGRRVIGKYVHKLEKLCKSDHYEKKYSMYVCDQEKASPVPDAIAYGDYNLDLHPTAGLVQKAIALKFMYPIPFRVTIPKDTTGILVGSAVSVERPVYGAFRLDPIRMNIGGALGHAIAIAETENLNNFEKINIEHLQAVLKHNKQYVGDE